MPKAPFLTLLLTVLAYVSACALVLLSPVLIDYFACLLLACLFIFLYGQVSRFSAGFAYLFYFAFVFFLACAWVSFRGLWYLDHRLAEALENKEVYVEGQVIDLPKPVYQEDSALRQRFDFRVRRLLLCQSPSQLETCERYSVPERALPKRLLSTALSDALWHFLFPDSHPQKIRLSLYHDLVQGNIEGGQTYRLLVKLKRPRASLNFYGFDYESWLFAQGYHAKGYVRYKGENDLSGVDNKSLSFYREYLRKRLQQAAGENVSSKSFALIQALALGDRSLMDKASQDLLRKTGTAHLLAISGMHIGLLSALIFFIAHYAIRFVFWCVHLLSGKPASVLSTWPHFSLTFSLASSVLFALLYALIAGFSLPTQRAFIMVLCYSLALVSFERVNFYSVWLFSLLLVLVFDPAALLSAGVYLSFGAVFVIQWFILGWFSIEQDKIAFSSTLKLMLRAQVAVFLGLMPLLLVLFSSFYPIALLANLFAIPFVSFLILPLSLLSLLLAAMESFLSSYVIALTIELLDFLLAVLEHLNAWQADVFAVHLVLPLVSIVALLLAMLLCLSPLPFSFKSFSWVFLFSCVFWAYQQKQEDKLAEGTFRLHVLDVGQGLAVLVETAHHRLLYDTGPSFGQHFNAGSLMVLPALRAGDFPFMPGGAEKASAGNGLDVMLLSHGDGDHIGGARALLAAYPVRQILGYERALYQKASAQISTDVAWNLCEQGQQWRWEGVDFEILGPLDLQALADENSNNRSCVLKISNGEMSVLIPGDIEAKFERQLLTYFEDDVSALRSNILIAPHHGSNTSSHAAFLQAVSPELVVVSAAYKSHFGHPHPQMQARVREANAWLLNTGDKGAIRIDSHRWPVPFEPEVLEFAREQKQRFWRID